MLDTKARKFVQPTIDTLGHQLVKMKLTPNQVTVSGFITGLTAGILIGFGYVIPSLIVLWLSGLLDVLDGTVARLTGKSSKTGAYLDLVFDRVVEGSMILGFYFFLPQTRLMLLIFMVAAMFNFTTFLVAATVFMNTGVKSMHYDIGIVERTETFILFSLMMLIPALGNLFLGIFNILMIITGIIRLSRIVQYSNQN